MDVQAHLYRRRSQFNIATMISKLARGGIKTLGESYLCRRPPPMIKVDHFLSLFIAHTDNLSFNARQGAHDHLALLLRKQSLSGKMILAEFQLINGKSANQYKANLSHHNEIYDPPLSY